MEIYEIILSILEKPDVPKFYRELKNVYQSNKMIHEAEAIDYLIEKRFKKNDNDSPNS